MPVAYRDEKYLYISFELSKIMLADPRRNFCKVTNFLIENLKSTMPVEEVATECNITKAEAAKCLERLKEINFEVIEGTPAGY